MSGGAGKEKVKVRVSKIKNSRMEAKERDREIKRSGRKVRRN